MANKFLIKRGSAAPNNAAIDNYELVYNYTDNELWTKHNGSVVKVASGNVGTVTNVVAGNGLTGGGTTSATLDVGAGTGISVAADLVSTNDSQIVHDNLSGFVANEHIDHSGVSILAGTGLTGGGTIASSRTLNVVGENGLVASANAIGLDISPLSAVGANNLVDEDLFAVEIAVGGAIKKLTASSLKTYIGGGTITAVQSMTNDYVLTASGSTTLQGESNLRFGGQYLSIQGNDPSNTYGVKEKLRIHRSGNNTDRQLQIYEMRHSGGREFLQTFNLDITTDNSTGYTYTQGSYGGSSYLEFDNAGALKIYNDSGVASGSRNAITPSLSMWIKSDNNILMTGKLGIGWTGQGVPNRALDVKGGIELSADDNTLDLNNFTLRRDSGGGGNIDVPGDMTINLDANNNQTDAVFEICANGSATGVFKVGETGIVTTGTWQGTAVGLAYGGTGATSAAAARVNLQLGDLALLDNASISDVTGLQTALDGKVPTSRTISGVGLTGTGSLASNRTFIVDYLAATDDRDVKPNAITTSGRKQVRAYFTSLEGLTGTAGSDWQDLLVLSTYSDGSGGDMNALAFDKSTQQIKHYLADQSATTWGTAKTIAYTDSTMTGTWQGTAINATYIGGLPASKITSGAFDIDRLPTAAVTNGDINNVPTADNVYDFVTGQGYLTSVPNHSASLITSGTLNNARLNTDMQLTSSAPRYRLQESDVTNTPNWWMVADGGNYSIRLNNTGTYPLVFQTNGTNDAVTGINLGYSTAINGTLEVNNRITSTGNGGFTIGNYAGYDRIQNTSNSFSFLTDGNGYANMTFGTVTAGTWNGSVIASAYLDADTAHLSGTQTFSGTKTFSSAVKLESELDFTGNGNKIIDVETLEGNNYLLIRHHNPVGNLFENALKLTANGSAELYYNNSKKFETTNTGATVTGNIAVSGTVDGRDVASDGSKLDGIESGATADQSASEILTAIKTVDGIGSGLDADLLDGVQGASFLRSDATSGTITSQDWNTYIDGTEAHFHSVTGHTGSNRPTGAYTYGVALSYSVASQGKFQLYAPETATLGTSTNQGLWYRSGWNTTYRQWAKIWDSTNDGTGSGLDADLLDNIDSSGFLRSNVADTIGAQLTMGTQTSLVASNYGHGVFGVYSATKYQHVWSMGTAYKGPADGASTGNIGNLYGLAWSYNPDYGATGNNAQSKAGLSHQLLLANNGVTFTALGNGMWTKGHITIGTNNYALYGIDTFNQVRNLIKIDSSNRVMIGDASAAGVHHHYPSTYSQINTDYGYLQIGPQNVSHCHYSTDRANHWFNQMIYVNGGVFASYNSDLVLKRNGGPADRIEIKDTHQIFYAQSAERFRVDVGGVDVTGAITATSQITTDYGVRFNNGATDFMFYNNTGDNIFYLRDLTNAQMLQTWGVNDVTMNKPLKVASGTAESALRIDADAARGTNRYALDIVDDDTNGRGTVRIVNASGTGIINTTQGSNWNMQLVSADNGSSPAMSMGVRMQSFEGRANGHYHFDEDYSGQWFSGLRYAGATTNWQVGYRDGSSGDSPDYLSRARIMVDNNGNFHADADVIAYSSTIGSDIKLKKNVKDINYGLKDVLNIRAVEFDWKEKRQGKHDIGFIAQEIEKIIPEVVNEVTTIGESAKEGDTHKVVDYAKLTSVLIKAVQEQQQQINKLEEKLNG